MEQGFLRRRSGDVGGVFLIVLMCGWPFHLPSGDASRPSSAAAAAAAPQPPPPSTNISLLPPPQVVTNRSDGLCVSLITSQGDYNCTEYMVQTNDGFLLGVQRMSSNNVEPTKGAVFLMHGLLVGGDVWVINEPSEGLGFVLADAGYDVWIGNTRTTRFSFGHVSLQRNDHAFWDWCLDEMAEQDLPAMLGMVFETVGEKVQYIGYSQGSQQAFAAFSEGHLLSMVDKVVMLAPIAYVDHGSAPVEIGLFDLHIDQILQLANVHEFSTKTHSGTQMVELICKNNDKCFQSWIFLFAGNNCCLNMTKRSLLDKYETQATSVKNLMHLAQQGRSSTFAKFDYGLFGNLRRYDPTDVARLVANLGGAVNMHTHPSFGHLDFILADSANTQIYPQILSFLEAL
ncbi:hypothetical protein GOP47_0017633 [Adiantum capillus-veneris]|uniref:Lipase n=1 Tax=Adiantum capillus-veneris TaxID=13818 RepID=A0A9D4ZB01_ADICA|nr:hypothetical protein GOP47_0017633 [Adiantum capillus-veneris]